MYNTIHQQTLITREQRRNKYKNNCNEMQKQIDFGLFKYYKLKLLTIKIYLKNTITIEKTNRN